MSLVIVSLAFVAGFGAISLADLDLDEYQGSWFVSIVMLDKIVFTPIGGKMAEIWGIKKTFLLCSPLIVLGWILLGSGLSTFGLFLGRILTGIGTSMLMVSPNIYIAETVHPSCRATLSSMVGFAYSAGICLLWMLGYFFTWQVVAYISSMPALLSFLAFLYLPDSPYWLLKNQRNQQAYESLKLFRPNETEKEVIEEFNEMLEHFSQKQMKKVDTFINRIRSPAFVKPMVFMAILYSLYFSTGQSTISSYLQLIMMESKIELRTETCAIILGVAQLMASILTFVTIQKLPPKPTFVICAAIKTASLAGIGAYFLLLKQNPDFSIWSWIPLVMCFLTYSTHAFLVTITWNLIGEIFPAETRNFAAGITECIGYIVIFAILKSYVIMIKTIGLDGIFFILAGFGALSAIYGSLSIPDHRNKSLVKIEKNNCKTPLISK